MNLNKEEIVRGCAITIFPCLFLLGWVISWPISIACGFLYAMGGAENSWKGYRRIIIPLLIGIGCYWLTHVKLVALSSLLMFGTLSIGYGIPSTQPYDEGSWLGKIFYKLFDGEETLAKWATHGTIAIILLLVAIIPYYIGRRYGW